MRRGCLVSRQCWSWAPRCLVASTDWVRSCIRLWGLWQRLRLWWGRVILQLVDLGAWDDGTQGQRYQAGVLGLHCRLLFCGHVQDVTVDIDDRVYSHLRKYPLNQLLGAPVQPAHHVLVQVNRT